MHIVDEESSYISEFHGNLNRLQYAMPKRRGRKFKDEESKKKWEDVMAVKRKKVFTSIVKKEVSKQHRAKINKHKEMLIQCRKAALQCQKVVRQKAVCVKIYRNTCFMVIMCFRFNLREL